MKEIKKLRVEIIGYEDQLNTLAIFLRKIEYLGNVGSSRTLSLWIDGDGDARLKVEFPHMNEKIPLDTKALSIGGKTEDDFLSMEID